jgi:hypothetical protein
MGAVVWAEQDALLDDTYLTLTYARTLAEHGQWALIPGVPANSAESPLNVITLAAVTVAVRDPAWAVGVVAMLNALFLTLGLFRLGSAWGVGRRLAAIVVPLLILNPLLASTLGMESMLAVTLLVWLIERGVAGDVTRFGWLTGLLMLVRLDLVVVAAAVWVAHGALRRPEWLGATFAMVVRAVVVVAPWLTFSWLYFGTAVPDTLALPRDEALGGFADGLWELYHPAFPDAVGATLVVVGLGLLVALLVVALGPLLPEGRDWSIVSAPLAGLAYFGALTLLGVPPYVWYYGVPVAGALLALGWALARLSYLMSRVLVPWAAVLAVALVASAPALAVWWAAFDGVRPLQSPHLFAAAGTSAEYERMGRDLGARVEDGTAIRSAGEDGDIGALLYFCDCTLVDRLSARFLVIPELEAHRNSHWLVELNYVWLRPSEYQRIRGDLHLDLRPGHVDDESRRPAAWNVFSPTQGREHYVLGSGAVADRRP